MEAKKSIRLEFTSKEKNLLKKAADKEKRPLKLHLEKTCIELIKPKTKNDD